MAIMKIKQRLTNFSAVARGIVIGLLCGVALCGQAETSYNLKKDFAMLDTVVANMDGYMDAWQKHIDEIRLKTPVPSDMARYVFFRRKYLEYVKFCSDSAIVYAHLCRKTAFDAGLGSEQQASADLDLAYATVLQGNYILADSIIRRLGPIENFPEALRWRVAVLHLEYSMRVAPLYNMSMGNSMLHNLYTLDLDEVWKQYGPYLASDNWMTDYYKAMCVNTDMRPQLTAWLDSVNKPSIEAAMLYIAMAKKSMAAGDSIACCHYLILSAANDIMSANRESSSLPMLLYTPFIKKRSKQAVNYAMACIKMADGYNDLGRSFDIVKANSIITTEYMKVMQKMAFHRNIFAGILVLAVILVAVSLYVARKKLKRRESSLNAAFERNEHLRDILTELTGEKERLESSVTNRDTQALDMFLHTSDYIKNMDKFVKTVENMLVAGQPGKARKALEKGCSDEFLPQFYDLFDKWFLSCHPDFIERFCDLLKPEAREHFSHPQGGLSPELRIYAMVSLGVTDSVSIADFLHYSPQTVYNYRLRVRHDALIQGKGFAAAVARMYHDNDGEKSQTT